MYEVTAIVLLVLGLMQMIFGISLFYLFLPLWYAMFGAYIGIGISQNFFNQTTWFGELSSWLLVFGFALLLGVFPYRLEPYRRYLIGGLVGVVLGLMVVSAFQVGAFATFAFVVLGGFIFAILTKIIFDPILIIGSSFIGAALTLDSLYILFRFSWLNRVGEGTVGDMLWVLLAILGIALQFGQLTKIKQAVP